MGNSKYENYFDEIYEGALLIAPKILLSHEPINLSWCYSIHGHDHSNWVKYPNTINLVQNVINFQAFNLNNWANSGPLSKIDDIHRLTIDNAIDRKSNK